MTDMEIYNKKKQAVKYLIVVLICFIVLGLLTGCSSKQPDTIYKIKTVEVKVPVREPLIVPRITCDFEGTGLVPTEKLIRCISKQKAFIKKLEDSNVIKYVDTCSTISSIKK